jgi:hypothetical protein
VVVQSISKISVHVQQYICYFESSASSTGKERGKLYNKYRTLSLAQVLELEHVGLNEHKSLFLATCCVVGVLSIYKTRTF